MVKKPGTEFMNGSTIQSKGRQKRLPSVLIRDPVITYYFGLSQVVFTSWTGVVFVFEEEGEIPPPFHKSESVEL